MEVKKVRLPVWLYVGSNARYKTIYTTLYMKNVALIVMAYTTYVTIQ